MNTLNLIGNTPLVELFNIEKEFNLNAHLFAKLDMFNLTGSAKDRAALYIIEKAEKDGRLKQGSTIIEPTSGNTGISDCMNFCLMRIRLNCNKNRNIMHSFRLLQLPLHG